MFIGIGAGDVIILLISVFVIAFCVIAFRKKTSPSKIKTVAVYLLIWWVPSILLPNLPLLLSPLTPSVRGVVIDDESRKPLPNIKVKVGWGNESTTFGGVSASTYKSYTTTTDEKGEFYIPRTLKYLSMYFPWGLIPVVRLEYHGIIITAYSYDYEATGSGVEKMVKTSDVPTLIAVKPIKDGKSYLKNIVKVWGMMDHLSAQEKEFLLNTYKIFEKKFSYANVEGRDLNSLAHLFIELGKPVEAVMIFQKTIEKYPSSISAERAREDIERMKKLYNLK